MSGMRQRRVNRRRGPSRIVFDRSIPSPCLQLCQLDEDNKTCLGCGRYRDEIRNWSIYNADEKITVWKRLGREIVYENE